jgi:hypothetical protein
MLQCVKASGVAGVSQFENEHTAGANRSRMSDVADMAVV